MPEDEGVNIETSEITLSSPICLEAASAPVAHPPRLRKSREQRRSDLISQGGRKVSKPCHIYNQSNKCPRNVVSLCVKW